MRNKPETVHAYNIPRLNWWFLVSSVLFVAAFALMIWVDYSGGEIRWLGLKGDRRWKEYQREFYELERQRLAYDAEAAEVRAQADGLDSLREQLAAGERQLAAQESALAALRETQARAQVEADRVMRQFTMKKASRDEVRSFFEAALARNALNPDAREVREWRDKVETQNQLVDRWELRKQEADAALAAATAELTARAGEREDLTRRINRLTATRDLLTNRLAELNSKLVQTVVNAPVIEFALPTYKVEQIVVENHHVDVNFTTVPRVDRCETCHKGIDRKPLTTEERAFREKHNIDQVDWDALPQPLRSHPRLDLFVADTSPHPSSTFGCTVCHWGWDRETDFSRAGHTPDHAVKYPHAYDELKRRWERVAATDDDEDDDAVRPAAASAPVVEMTQRDAWIKNHNWYHEHYNLQPMRQQKYIEASCLKCHQGQTHIEGAPQLDHGRRLIEQLGCWSCHKMKQLETYTTHRVAAGESFHDICRLYDVNPDEVRALNNLPAEPALTAGRELSIPVRTLRKPGPSLYKVADKTSKGWTRKWLADPVAFRANTYMPKFWGLHNNNDPVRDNVEINAVTEFLFAVSEPVGYPTPPVAGDSAQGKNLVDQLGCMACHVVDDNLMKLRAPARLAKFMDTEEYRRYRSQGPQLSGSGSKLDQNWLYAWLKDPKQYHPRTKMPNLRLADQEAADLAAYLVSLRHAPTDTATLPPVDEGKLAEVTVEYLQVTLPRREAEARLHNLDEFIEPYFVAPELGRYYREPTLLAREAAQVAALRKEYEETFDDALQKRADQLEASLTAVRAAMAAAQSKVAALGAVDKQNIFLGSRLISRYGCYSCHDVRGFETAKPIGTELSEWGSKLVNKLDFGLLPLEHDRISWLKQKLKAPRSYDTGRIGITRSPQEHLKMPQFNLTEAQIDQIVTVVAGMTDEKLLPSEPRPLSPEEFHIERGRWLSKELNCAACHQIEGRGWAIRATNVPAGMEPPMLSGRPGELRQGQRTQPDWLFHFLKAPETGEVRPWLQVRMPTFDLTDAEANVLVKYFALEGCAQFPHHTPQINTAPEHLAAGEQLFTQLRCALCHIVEGQALGKPLAEIPAEDLPRLAPNLSLAAARLQREWLIERWLPEPLAQVPGTRMPQYEYGDTIAPNILDGDSRRQREALVDYILSLGAE